MIDPRFASPKAIAEYQKASTAFGESFFAGLKSLETDQDRAFFVVMVCAHFIANVSYTLGLGEAFMDELLSETKDVYRQVQDLSKPTSLN